MSVLNPFSYHSPSNLSEACQLLRSLPQPKILAGGTFVINNLRILKAKGLRTPEHLVSLRRVPELRGISLSRDTITIGAMTTIAELFSSDIISKQAPLLKLACRELGTNPIRHMGTIGENLACRYAWTELPAVMLALDAQLHFVDRQAAAEIISAENFFKNSAKTDELLSHVTLKKDPSAHKAYIRFSKSASVDIPLLAICAWGQLKNNRIQNIRIVINNTTTFAQRDYALEKFLTGKTLSPELLQENLPQAPTTLIAPGDEYRNMIFPVALKNALRTLMENPS